MIISFIAIIFVWELIFQVASVRVTMGQTFKYFVDYTVTINNESSFQQLLVDEKALDSLNILKLDRETLDKENNVLFTRLELKDGDVIFTDKVKDEDGYVRAQAIIDNGYVYTLDRLLSDAENYLESFKTNGEFDDAKIQANFLQRMSRDNRFRTEQEKADGIVAEKARILRLSSEVQDFRYLLSQDDELFFRYTRFEQTYEIAIEENKLGYLKNIEFEKNNGRENARYGINLGKLKGNANKKSIASYFSVTGEQGAENVVLMAFDFFNNQPNEQFEVITFINSIVRSCSNIFEG